MTRQTVIKSAKVAGGLLLIFAAALILKLDLVIPLVLASFFIYLRLSSKYLDLKDYNLLDILLLYTIIVTLSYFIVRSAASPLYVPFCLIPMISTLLFNDLRISLLLTIVSALTVASIAWNNFYLLFLFLISGIISAVLVFSARRRSVLIRSGFIIGLIQALTLLVIQGFKFDKPFDYLILFVNGIACGVIVIGILPVFEYLFKTVTNISLLELADFNHPLLQKMTLEAPGTYHHSLIVGNLSDAACQAVGANALLARVGAYYHDIGKLSKPEYFSENQNGEFKKSKHEVLSPAMSKLVIMNHVKEGVEMAKRHKLNPGLIDFIQQHHGSSLVFYFYRKALLENPKEDQEVNEEGFRYPGPKPRTKEAAIVLLADSVEAATRTLKEPHPGNVEEMVHKVINNKFIDGQLDECSLTLKDLEKISAVFIRILSGIYHSRVTYP